MSAAFIAGIAVGFCTPSLICVIGLAFINRRTLFGDAADELSDQDTNVTFAGGGEAIHVQLATSERERNNG